MHLKEKFRDADTLELSFIGRLALVLFAIGFLFFPMLFAGNVNEAVIYSAGWHAILLLLTLLPFILSFIIGAFEWLFIGKVYFSKIFLEKSFDNRIFTSIGKAYMTIFGR